MGKKKWIMAFLNFSTNQNKNWPENKNLARNGVEQGSGQTKHR